MHNQSRKLALFILLSAFSLPLLAQTTISSGSPYTPPDSPQGVPAGSSILYDQTADPGIGYSSQDFPPGEDIYDSQIADDFVVGDAQGWTVTQVNVLGEDEASPATVFNVWIYADNAATPGAEVCVRAGQTGVNDGFGNAEIELSSSCFLPMGTYWVSVQAVKNGGGADQWFWVSTSTINGTAAMFRNPNNGFGTGCTSFSSLGTCAGAGSLDANFQIAGELGGSAGPSRATFAVTKVFADGNDEDEVVVALDCNTGLILDQDKVLGNGESVEFVVTQYTPGVMNCSIVEGDSASGYSASYVGTGIDGGCEWTSIPGDAAYSCTVTNSPDPVDIVIHKEWVVEGSITAFSDEFGLDLYCQASGMTGPGAHNDGGNSWHGYVNSNGDGTFNWQITPLFPSSTCYVSEYGVESAVEIDNPCGNLVARAGSGAECTITNTVFYEGIPTLSQYGMAIMALLMLGLGFVGFRRMT